MVPECVVLGGQGGGSGGPLLMSRFGSNLAPSICTEVRADETMWQWTGRVLRVWGYLSLWREEWDELGAAAGLGRGLSSVCCGWVLWLVCLALGE